MELRNVPGPKAQALIARDREVITPAVGRPYGFVMDHGRGAEVWDVDGYRYLDFIAGIAVVTTGHSHPAVVQAIQQQAERFIHISADYYHEPWVRVAEKLARIAPFGDEPGMSFMTNSGTESVEAAIKLARYVTGRKFFIGFLGGFHGRTMGSLAFTARKAAFRARFFPWMPGVVHAPYPNPYRPMLRSRGSEGYGETVVRYIEEQILGALVPPDEVAAFLVEPIQGEGGYIVPPDDFFPALRRLADKYGILIIADEVQTGVGRTGKWWAIEHWHVQPDLVASAKGLASGVPFGAMIARKRLASQWPPGAHGNTYGGNPLASVAALVTLDLVEKELMANAAEVGAYALQGLRDMMARHAHIGDVRGKGLMLALEFVRDRASKEPFPELRDLVEQYAFRMGLLTMGSGASVLRMAPPLVITRAQVDEAWRILDAAITRATREVAA